MVFVDNLCTLSTIHMYALNKLLEKECDMIRISHNMPYKLFVRFINCKHILYHFRAYKKITLYQQYYFLLLVWSAKVHIKREREREIEGKKASKIMKPNFSFLSKLLILQYLSVLCISQEFDFFYFVQQVSHDEFCIL